MAGADRWPGAYRSACICRQSFAFNAFRYRDRNLMARFFGILKHARGLATYYDKRPDNFLAAIKIFSARLWINALTLQPRSTTKDCEILQLEFANLMLPTPPAAIISQAKIYPPEYLLSLDSP
jgi:hypothetical protein